MTSINRVGEKHGQLTVIYEVLPKKKNTRVWRCICSCGVETTVYGCNLSNGHTKSCGCYRESGDAYITHGTSNRNKKTNSTKKYHALFSKKDRLWQVHNETCEEGLRSGRDKDGWQERAAVVRRACQEA